ncbi:MAG TPA: hypothetical protein DD381_04870 [Lentisphaeria bacterium]|nr:MAG: hypothetical protein A2X47_01780 [Lentisphaerae bacterium GWF2_38_69]HBM15662.1 hypothetical protein [Lentisphaeria bacterium]
MATMNELENTTHIRFAFLLILIGLLLAVDSFFKISLFIKLWPLLALMLGIGFIGIFNKQRKRGFSYLVIGIYLILFTILALFCNFTSWDLLSIYWPIFITFLGVVFLAIYFYRKTSRATLFIGVILIFLSLYFLFIFSLGSDQWWTIFILVGLSILLSRFKK